MSKSRNSQFKQRLDYDPDRERTIKPQPVNRKAKRVEERALRTKDVSVFYEDVDDWDEWDDQYDFRR